MINEHLTSFHCAVALAGPAWLQPASCEALIKFSSFQMKKSLVESNPPSATKYMKRFLSPSNQERSPYPGKEVRERKYI